MKEKAKFIIICGLPGSGKTTLATRLADELAAVRLCPDDWMTGMGMSLWDNKSRDGLEHLLWELGQELLRLHQNVIIEFGSWSKSERDELLRAGRACGAIVDLYCLDPPLDEIRTRLTKRGMEGDDIIPDKLEEYSSKFERPDPTEQARYDSVIKLP